MSNQEWLASLPADEFYDQLEMVKHTEAIWCTDSRLYMIEWLNKERTEPNQEEQQ